MPCPRSRTPARSSRTGSPPRPPMRRSPPRTVRRSRLLRNLREDVAATSSPRSRGRAATPARLSRTSRSRAPHLAPYCEMLGRETQCTAVALTDVVPWRWRHGSRRLVVRRSDRRGLRRLPQGLRVKDFDGKGRGGHRQRRRHRSRRWSNASPTRACARSSPTSTPRSSRRRPPSCATRVARSSGSSPT